MTSQNTALEALRDIHLPDAVSLWPPAPGWWVVLALAALLAAALFEARRRHRRSVRRAALEELHELERSFQRSGDVTALAAAVSGLLRRVALACHVPGEVARLHGRAWSAFLAGSSRKHPFPAPVAASLEHVVYRGLEADLGPEVPTDWLSAARHWIEDNA